MTWRRASREVRLVLIAAGIVVLPAAAAAVLMLNPVRPEGAGITLKSVEPVEVVQVTIRNAHGTLAVVHTGEGYLVGDIPAELVDVDALIELLTNSGQVTALRSVASAPGDLAPAAGDDVYGLSEPAARVEVAYADKSALTLSIGGVERVTGGHYFSLEGDPTVYLMPAERCAGFLLPKKAYVDHLITPKLARSSPLSALLDVTLTGGSLDEPVTVESVAAGGPEVARAAISFGAATHIVRLQPGVRGRGIYELDQTYGVAMLGPLLGIFASDIVDYNLTHEEVLAFGFDRPTMQVAFDLRNGVDAEVEHYALAVLHKDGDFLMTCNDNGVIYAVQEPPFLHVEYEKLLVRWFLSPLLMDVRAVELTIGDQDYDFALTGETNAEKQVTCNGKELEIDRFRALYRLLISAAHDGRLLDDIVVEGVPHLRLTYHYVDEEKQADVMELYPGDARRVYVRVNGATELAMRETYLTRVQEAVSAMWTNDPIETDW